MQRMREGMALQRVATQRLQRARALVPGGESSNLAHLLVGSEGTLGIITGADNGYTEIYGGDLTSGRWFTSSELSSGAAVVVLESDIAAKLFGHIQPIGKRIRVGGRPMDVIGIYEAAANIFEPPGQEQFLALNAELAKEWPVLAKAKAPPEDADEWKDVKEKKHLIEK